MIKKRPVLVCDGCGQERMGDLEVSNNQARLSARSEGWQFFNYTQLQVNGKNRARQWDSCPECQLPEISQVVSHLAAAAS